MSDLIRDAPIGQLIRFFTKNRYLKYPEEKDDFQCPTCYGHDGKNVIEKTISPTTASGQSSREPTAGTTPIEKVETREEAEEKAESPVRPQLPRGASKKSIGSGLRSDENILDENNLERVATRLSLKRSVTRQDLERAFSEAAIEKKPTQPIQPERLDDGTILVDWYDTDDPANPQNWSFWKKILVSTQIYMYTVAVYMGSSIYTPSEQGVIERFDVSITVASLGLALYVLAYGIGPMLWSPLSEIPVIGRNPPYMATYAIFVILCVPTALVDNIGGLLVLRFLQGFFGSPCLATGGASLQDMYSILKLPYVLSMWAFAATCGPALGPIISGFSVAAENWRWSLWEMLWMSGPVWISMFFCLPETYNPNILLRRAQRLRARTGNMNLKAQSEIDQANMSFSNIAVESLWRPIELIFKDPSVAFTAGYIALAYGIYYSFFEAFPLVYVDMYGFNLGELGLAFLSITVGVIISIAAYWAYVFFKVEPEIIAHGLGPPERRLIPALFASFCLPIGLFIFAWTADPHIHWIVTMIGICIFTIGIFMIFQCVFLYLPLSYPQYAASLFAGNDLARSTIAFAAVLFSRPLYINLGIGPGTSMLGAFTAACVVGVYLLWWYGDRLRARSKFSAK